MAGSHPRKRTRVEVAEDQRMADTESATEFQTLAEKHWLKGGKPTQSSMKEIWEAIERQQYDSQGLAVLEQTQLLERWLWPHFRPGSSQIHVLLLVMMVRSKSKSRQSPWQAFERNPTHFTSLFRQILSLSLDTSLHMQIRLHVLGFINTAFSSLDYAIVRKECAPLVSIGIWQNLTDVTRQSLLEQEQALRRAWRSSTKRLDSADDETKSKLMFDRRWLASIANEFIRHIYSASQSDAPGFAPALLQSMIYCERVIDFLINLLSQMPTRRYTRSLLLDLQLLPLLKLSPVFKDSNHIVLQDQFQLLLQSTDFPVNEFTAESLTMEEQDSRRAARLAGLQKIAYRHYREMLALLVLAHYGQLEQRNELEQLLDPLSDEDLSTLCGHLGLRIDFPAYVAGQNLSRSGSSAHSIQAPTPMSAPEGTSNRRLTMEILLMHHEKRVVGRERVRNMVIMPTEQTLYDCSLSRIEQPSNEHSVSLPRQNLQYLSTEDLLWRAFVLHRCEAYYAIRRDIEQVLKRLRPRPSPSGVAYGGFSRMALPIPRPSILDATPPTIGEIYPASVRAEVALDFSKMDDSVRREWEGLRGNEVVYLLAVAAPDRRLNGHSSEEIQRKGFIRYLRCAEVIQVFDERGRHLREEQREQARGQMERRARIRKLHVRLDCRAYQVDTDPTQQTTANVYESINLIVRRKGRENNYRALLNVIKDLLLSDAQGPEWLREVLLGYGDPEAATYRRLEQAGDEQKLDFRDTFLDKQHLINSFPENTVDSSAVHEPDVDTRAMFVLREKLAALAGERKPKPADAPALEGIVASTYSETETNPYAGPDPSKQRNKIRFTPTQVCAINSGMRPGLTVVVGPPGTGKTDVAVQIASNLYHDRPKERILLMAHSNQALNQLFQKISELDINPRHLLRLGRGEEELERSAAGQSFGKLGRIESFMESRAQLLGEVSRLAACLSAPGEHGQSCETAEYFDIAYITPAWRRYSIVLNSPESSAEDKSRAFPFRAFFSNAPRSLSPEGRYAYIRNIFTSLAEIRPFELLKTDRAKSNYLFTTARIVAMTTTHAAIHRREILDAGFTYQSLVMEEAAQITEVETFIALTLQRSVAVSSPNGTAPSALRRIVLIGDHQQNAPIIQLPTLSTHASLDQSTFARLIRLGVPHILLSAQGRSRASLTSLWSWRYPDLTSLPASAFRDAAFSHALPGFKYTSQFLDVGDLRGVGESSLRGQAGSFQNLAEAEYAVALFQYMRLLHYPASIITILTPYASQRSLIRDVLRRRCAGKPLFGLPRHVSTADRYQGSQNDIVILSLVRTRELGYLRDLRRMTVAMSRARLSLFVLGSKEVFRSRGGEVARFFEALWEKPVELALRPGENFGDSTKPENETTQQLEEGEVAVSGVEELGKIVYDMTVKATEDRRAKSQAAQDVSIRPPEDEDWTSSSGITDDSEVEAESVEEQVEEEEQ